MDTKKSKETTITNWKKRDLEDSNKWLGIGIIMIERNTIVDNTTIKSNQELFNLVFMSNLLKKTFQWSSIFSNNSKKLVKMNSREVLKMKKVQEQLIKIKFHKVRMDQTQNSKFKESLTITSSRDKI